MNRRTTEVVEAWLTAGGPPSAIPPPDPLRDLRAGQMQLLPERERHVVGACHRVEQRAALEDDSVALPDLVERAPAKARDLDAIHEHPAAVGAQEADQVPEEDRLASAAPADDDRDRARGDFQVELMH